jgi:imidazolonepropionase-like amidohydrolase
VRRNGNIDAANAFLPKLTLALHKAGVPLIAGSDSPVIPGLFPGASLHEDLRLLVAAGLSPHDAIDAATRNPGEFAVRHLRSKDRFGQIKPGYRADLLLVRKNPLEDIVHLRDPAGLMVRGRWLDRAQLDSLRTAASISQ